MNSLQEYYKNALLDGLCDEYKQEWRKCHDDKEKLMKLALKQQSLPHLAAFAAQGRGLTKDYLLENFGGYINGKRTFEDVEGVKGYKYQMYVDYEGYTEVEADVTNIMWCSNLNLELPICKCPVLYISNHSDVHIVCNGYNHLIIYLFDDSRVSIEDADENTHAMVYRYSDESKVETGEYCLGKVKDFRKEIRL